MDSNSAANNCNKDYNLVVCNQSLVSITSKYICQIQPNLI